MKDAQWYRSLKIGLGISIAILLHTSTFVSAKGGLVPLQD